MKRNAQNILWFVILMIFSAFVSVGCQNEPAKSEPPQKPQPTAVPKEEKKVTTPATSEPVSVQKTAAPAEAATPQGITAPADDANTLRLRYAVILETAASQTPRAPENMNFATGTRFKLLLAPARDLYLYLVHEGTTGDFILLNPIPGAAASLDRLVKGTAHAIPLDGWYLFDANAGTERIYVIAAPHKVERMEQLLEQSANAKDSNTIKQALDGLRQRQEAGYSASKVVGTDFSELSLTGSTIEQGVIIGIIELRHQ